MIVDRNYNNLRDLHRSIVTKPSKTFDVALSFPQVNFHTINASIRSRSLFMGVTIICNHIAMMLNSVLLVILVLSIFVVAIIVPEPHNICKL